MYRSLYCKKFLKVQFLFFNFLSSVNTSAFDLTHLLSCVYLLPSLSQFLNLTASFLIQILPLIKGSSIQHLDEKDKKLLPLLGKVVQLLSQKESFRLQTTFIVCSKIHIRRAKMI